MPPPLLLLLPLLQQLQRNCGTIARSFVGTRVCSLLCVRARACDHSQNNAPPSAQRLGNIFSPSISHSEILAAETSGEMNGTAGGCL